LAGEAPLPLPSFLPEKCHKNLQKFFAHQKLHHPWRMFAIDPCLNKVFFDESLVLRDAPNEPDSAALNLLFRRDFPLARSTGSFARCFE
jgi:hypothetical protein